MGIREILLFSATAFASLSWASASTFASELLRPEIFAGTYVPKVSPLDSESVKGVREITIRVDKSTNTLYANISRAMNEDDEGLPFIPPLTLINLEPRILQSKMRGGCMVFEQSSRAETSRIVSMIDETFKAGCWMRTRYQHTEISIQFADSPEEIWIGVGAKPSNPSKKYFLKRLPSASETTLSQASNPSEVAHD